MELTIGRFLRLIVVMAIFFTVVWLLYTLSSIITVLIISALLAYILDPLASYLEARGLSRTQATSLIFSVITILFILTAWKFVPSLIKELFTLQNGMGGNFSTNVVAKIEQLIHENLPFLNVRELNLQLRFDQLMNMLSNEIVAVLENLVSVISAIAIIPFVTFFLLKDGRDMKKLFISYIPNRYFEMMLNVLHKIDGQLGGYLRGQFIEAVGVAMLSVTALFILNVKYFTIIGIFAGFANLIPYVGPVAGMIPAIAVTLGNNGDMLMVLYIIIAFSLVQFIDNMVLQPIVLSKSVNLHPLVIVFAVLIGGQFFGVLGMFLAVPAAGIVKVTSSELYKGIRKFHLI